jgi:Zn-dependent protease with chaperone function
MVGAMLTGCAPAPVGPATFRLPTSAETFRVWDAAKPLVQAARLSASPSCTITITIQSTPKINAAVSALHDAACRGRVSLMVTEGALSAMNLGELRGVLAHEIGHVALNHRTAAERRRVNGAAAQTTTSLMGKAAAFVPGSVAVGLWISSLAMTGVAELIARGDDREQEREADRYAVALLLKLGGRSDCLHLAAAFEKIAAAEGGAHSIEATHPRAADRAEEVRRACTADARPMVGVAIKDSAVSGGRASL